MLRLPQTLRGLRGSRLMASMSPAAQSYAKVLKEGEARIAKTVAGLPDDLKHIGDNMNMSAEFEKLHAEYPEITEQLVAKVAEADKPGIRATVGTPKDPSRCKYTEEGTLLHDMMKEVAKGDRRQAYCSPFEYTIPEAKLAELKAKLEADLAAFKGEACAKQAAALEAQLAAFEESNGVTGMDERKKKLEEMLGDAAPAVIAQFEKMQSTFTADLAALKSSMPTQKDFEATYDAEMKRLLSDSKLAYPDKISIL